MSKVKMLWTGEHDEKWEETFKEEFDVTKATLAITGKHQDVLVSKPFEGDPEMDKKVIEMLADNEIVMLGYDGLSAEVIKHCPDLKVIVSVRDGPEENVNIKACTEAGIPVMFSGGRCVHAVAETTVALMMMLARRIAPVYDIVKKDKWTKETFGYIRDKCSFRTELFRKTLALIGCGRNGQEIVKICRGFDMNIITYDPYLKDEVAEKLGVKKVSLEEALSQGDYIVMMARVTEETKGMINAERIALMKPTAYFVNTARAALTDEEAILDALFENRIAGAALDVAMTEPLGENSRMYDLPSDKLILTPHISGGSVERVSFQYELCWKSLQNFLKGSKEITIKNPEVFDSPA
ncbi:MAG: hypothetical protein IIZ74_10225, partial [Erysipelotrichaceae bacterium]|nr:hypothetical protein [Erysipelotrichaceae bacterium]